MKELIATVADIQRFSTHDGPGIRTTVFFKGCPLKCAWCHNPECISSEIQTLEYPEKCIGCQKCHLGCFSGAKVVCGQQMSENDVLAEILADKEYYQNDGGVTFSGGEPLLWRTFLSKMIDLCHENGINCAIETSLFIYDEEIFRKCDLVLADLKIWSDDLHQKYTGVSNEIIKQNFQKLNALGVNIVAKTPIIPEIDQEIEKISEFLKNLDNVQKYELLPYHPLGNSKREALGLKKQDFTIPSNELMKELRKYEFIRLC